MTTHAAVNVTTLDTDEGPVYSPIARVDILAKPQTRITFKKDRAPSAYSIQVRGRTDVTAPWVYIELYSTDTALDATNEAATFNGTDRYEATVNSYAEMQVITTGITNTLTPGVSDWPATIGEGLSAKATEVYAPSDVKDYAWRRATVFTPSGYTPAGGWPVIVMFANSGLLEDAGFDDALNGGVVMNAGSTLTQWLEAGFALVNIAMSGADSTLTGSPTDAFPWVRRDTTLSGMDQTGDDAKAQWESEWGVQWVRAIGAEKYGLNPNLIATYGRSGGGFQALYHACRPDQADPDSLDPIRRASSVTNAVIDNVGLSWLPSYDDAFTGGVAFESATTPGTTATDWGDVFVAEKQRTSICVFGFNETLNPGCQERLSRLPFYIATSSDTQDSHLIFVGSDTEATSGDGPYTAPLDAPWYGVGVTATGTDSHPTYHGLQLRYMLNGLSRVRGDLDQGEYWHERNSRLSYYDAGATKPLSGWTANADLADYEASSTADQFGDVIPWLRERFSSLNSYPTGTLDTHINVWFD